MSGTNESNAARFNPLEWLESAPSLDCDELAAALVAAEGESDHWAESARLLLSAQLQKGRNDGKRKQRQ
jgi:type IV secretory pathway TraG/TraD family ATPase VirD4